MIRRLWKNIGAAEEDLKWNEKCEVLIADYDSSVAFGIYRLSTISSKMAAIGRYPWGPHFGS